MSGWASDTDEERQNLHGKAIVRGLRSRSRQRLALYAMALLLVGIVLLLGVVYSEVTQMRTEIVASRQGASSPPRSPTPSSILSTSERSSTSASDTLSTWESPLSPGLHYCRNNLFLSGGVSDEVAGQTAEARAIADAATLKQVQAQEAIYVKWWSHNYQDYRAARKSGKLESDHEKDISQYELAYPRDSPWPCSAPAGQESNAQAGMSRWGQSGDGGKWLCRLPSLAQHGARRAAAAGAGVDACAIFSLGSANDFSFEESMIANTPCRIHTFDCSSNPPPKPLERHTFHSECMGRSVAESVVYNAAGKDAEALKGYVFKQYNTLMQEAGLKFVDLLKMDIEGGELAAFEELLVPENAALPYQISFEQHRFPQSPSYLDNSKVWDALWRAGYRAVAQEPNDFSGCCMEFTWVRVFC